MHKTYGQEPRDCYELENREEVSTARLLRTRFVLPLLAIYFLVMLAFSFFYVSFPVHAATELRWSVPRTGAFFSVLSLAMALVQGPVLKWASARFGDRPLVAGGGLILAGSFAAFSLGDGPPVWIAAILLALGNGLMWPSVMAILSRVGESHQGAIQGLATSAGAVASIAGLVLGGLLYGELGATVFFLPAAIVGVSLLVARGLPSS